MEDKNEINVLDELNKGARMGMDAIHFILPKVTDNKLRDELNNQYKEYENIHKQICELYPEYSNKEPHDTSPFNKIMTLYRIETKTLTDDTTTKLAELLMQGTNMGIIEGRRLLNHKHTDDLVNDLVQKYVDMQETAVEKLKEFL